tara:strand:+ start:31571 stop:31765 length:195 start_codon:yes stop_codon:yes gene_type:complete
MKVTLKDKIESAHVWIDQESGKPQKTVITGVAGDLLDSDDLGCGDAERALSHLVKLDLAEEVAT